MAGQARLGFGGAIDGVTPARGGRRDSHTPLGSQCVVGTGCPGALRAASRTRRGGGFGFAAGEAGWDADVGVGGEHVAGVSELALDDLHFVAGFQREGAGAAA